VRALLASLSESSSSESTAVVPCDDAGIVQHMVLRVHSLLLGQDPAAEAAAAAAAEAAAEAAAAEAAAAAESSKSAHPSIFRAGDRVKVFGLNSGKQ